MIFHLQTLSQVQKLLNICVYFLSVTETFFKFVFIIKTTLPKKVPKAQLCTFLYSLFWSLTYICSFNCYCYGIWSFDLGFLSESTMHWVSWKSSSRSFYRMNLCTATVVFLRNICKHEMYAWGWVLQETVLCF